MGSPAGDHNGRHGPRGLHHQTRRDNIRKRKRVREREEGRKGKGREEKRTFQRRGARKLSLFHEAGSMEQSLKAAIGLKPQFMAPVWSKIP